MLRSKRAVSECADEWQLWHPWAWRMGQYSHRAVEPMMLDPTSALEPRYHRISDLITYNRRNRRLADGGRFKSRVTMQSCSCICTWALPCAVSAGSLSRYGAALLD